MTSEPAEGATNSTGEDIVKMLTGDLRSFRGGPRPPVQRQ
jgi:hypothetical protein